MHLQETRRVAQRATRHGSARQHAPGAPNVDARAVRARAEEDFGRAVVAADHVGRVRHVRAHGRQVVAPRGLLDARVHASREPEIAQLEHAARVDEHLRARALRA